MDIYGRVLGLSAKITTKYRTFMFSVRTTKSVCDEIINLIIYKRRKVEIPFAEPRAQHARTPKYNLAFIL